MLAGRHRARRRVYFYAEWPVRDLLTTRTRREAPAGRCCFGQVATGSRCLVRYYAVSCGWWRSLGGSLAHLNADEEADLDLFRSSGRTRARMECSPLTTLLAARASWGWRRSALPELGPCRPTRR
jgi:hypothetical protein